MTDDSARLARFGTFELDVHAAELRKAGRLVALTGQPMRVLIALVGSAGDIVTREALQREIWGDDTHVDFDAGLATCINQIRTALGDRAVSPRFLETLPRRGYRFVAPVEWRAAPSDARGLANAAVFRRSSGRVRTNIRRGFVLLLIAVPLMWFVRGRSSPVRPVRIAVMPVDVELNESHLAPLSVSLTHALIGTLATEAGGRMQVASAMVSKELGDKTLDAITHSGIEYVVMVTMRSAGGPVFVHVKLVDGSGWVRWASDRTMPFEELERSQVRLAGELSKQVVQAVMSGQPALKSSSN